MFGTVFLIQEVVFLLYFVETSVVTSLAGPPREYSSLLGFWDKRRRMDGHYGRRRSLRVEGDRKGN